ncbi:hypothetical protein EMCRGX_G014625 [Ephydatia muelleri]
MPGRGRGSRSPAAGPGSDPKQGDVKPEATPEAPDQNRDIKEGTGEDKFPGGAKGRGRGTQAAAPGGKLSEELVEQMKQSLDLNKAEPQLSTCSAKQTEPQQQQQQQPCKSRSTGGTLPQDTHAASTTFNPNAPPFVPSSKYDPTSHASARSDVAQKHSQFEPTQATPTTTSLNVNAKAFVPSFAKAGGVGAEQVMREEDTQQYEDVLEEGLVLLDDIVDPYTIPGIMAEFEGGLDEQGVALLKTGAEILVTCTQYPATFERLQHKLRKLVEACFVGSPPAAPSPAQLALSKLCEMIVLWGLRLPDFRIVASKICELLFGREEVRSILLPCLKMYAPNRAVATSEEELQLQIAYTMFCAELFSRAKLVGNPVWILGVVICDWLDVLLATSREDAIYAVCNTLKLTGAILQCATQANVSHANKIVMALPSLMDKLNKLTVSGKLSSQCVEVIKRVLSLYSQGWGQPTSPDASLRENPLHVESKYDAASDTSDIPVTNPGEWDEYIGSEHGLEHPSLMAGHAEHQASIDSDVEDEFEQFIEEIEDFLMKQDMGEPLDEEER